MTRSVEDAMLVLQAISGPDAGDVSSVHSRLDFDAATNVKGLRVGYFPAWMKENPATEVDRAALETVKKVGMTTVEVSIPDWPYDSLNLILFAEGAAAFEEITLNHEVDQLKVQTYDAWPNIFRQSRFLSAVDFVQTDRLRRKVAVEMARVFSQVDLLLVPSLRDEMLTITNFTGHHLAMRRAHFHLHHFLCLGKRDGRHFRPNSRPRAKCRWCSGRPLARLLLLRACNRHTDQSQRSFRQKLPPRLRHVLSVPISASDPPGAWAYRCSHSAE